MHLSSFRLAAFLRSAAIAALTAIFIAPTLVQAQPQAPAAPASAPGERNVYTAGGQVRPAGPVAGDFAAAGGRIVLDQPVAGDASLMAGSVDVRAPVGDDLRAAGGDISIESRVGGELFAVGGNVMLARAAVVGRGASVHGGSVTLAGRIEGDLSVDAQKLRIDGEILGDVRANAADIELGPGARIHGALRYTSPRELQRAESAVIGGPVTREAAAAQRPVEERPPRRAWRVEGPGWVGGLLSYLGLLASAAVFLLVAPGFAAQTSDRIRATPALALAIGFGTLLALPVLAVLLFVTILGIPLAVTVLALYPVLLLAGFLAGVQFLARRLPPALRQPAPSAYAATMAYFALALLLVVLLGRLPFAGWVLVAVITIAGIGACVLELYGRRRGAGAGVAPATA